MGGVLGSGMRVKEEADFFIFESKCREWKDKSQTPHGSTYGWLWKMAFVDESVKLYFRMSFSIKEILSLFQHINTVWWCIRTLKRLNRKLCLIRRRNYKFGRGGDSLRSSIFSESLTLLGKCKITHTPFRPSPNTPQCGPGEIEVEVFMKKFEKFKMS